MRTPLGALIFISVMVLMDFYVFQAVKLVSGSASPKTRSIVYGVYWSLSIVALIGILLFVFTSPEFLNKKFRTYLFATVIGLFMAKAVVVLFLMIDDIRRAIQWVAAKLFFRGTEGEEVSDEGISRSVFLSWLGLAAGGTLFGSLIYGYSNQYNYNVKRQKLSFPNLPQAFRGLRIVHISDIHSGSFTNKDAVMKGVEKLMAQKPDIVLFTGDLVNHQATEMANYMDVFSRIKAPLGVYSTLGNHDYGDYVQWPIDGVSKRQNLENVKQVHAQLGWRLLMNEHIEIERAGEKIAILGIENWSNKARFPRYGDMTKAYAGADKYPFKILLSHDPSHWEGEVLQKYRDVDLMLSGHTHGMQFGIEIPGFRWSPVQYVYKQWAGLYEHNHQRLYVNRGFGFIGYPGRVGILPEITVLEFV
jgi:uncharacterized protein